MDGEWLPAVVEVTGLLQDPAFHVAKCAAEELRGEVWGYASHVMCFVNGWLLGDEKDLLEWAYCKWGYCDFKPEALYQAITEDFYTKHLKSSQHMFVYLDIAIEEQPIGTLLFELFSDVCPKTCENFRALCEGGVMSPSSGQELTYKNSCFHRLVKPVWIQGGDITGKGDGGESIYGPTFEDENYAIPHKGRGVLGMANKGRHSNGSQFYITLQPVPYLDKKCVAFGQLIEGTEVLQRLETVPTHNERPRVVCKVTNCGTFQP
ncbi:probable inactive peptidyl-prolyl cis-trans isomerase-like 6 isoform X14 [Gallus gallus]|uniref:probable inactive peptidyl-prolyl cis-trans isomerase-like 6 isoform X14 n=1 Tax=Gallus gallus TaxID=9031 RepID=UPI001F00D74A|nr:probable inactive peptidyl-prolyl cis-trans isomerase-like 6 isoform X14 [Gallus gallus]XP_046795595.1 probable inactive peptidyl-prolyl cis-trans isomerase-like 6 isoform X14 [Gallus gallus]